MKVNVKCEACGKIFKANTADLKKSRKLKQSCKTKKFYCWQCIGIENGVQGVGLMIK